MADASNEDTGTMDIPPRRARKSQLVGSVYDDVFRTMMSDCRQLVIPLVNEMFHLGYTGKEKVEPCRNEHFINVDGHPKKVVTDSAFRIVDAENRDRTFLIECQSRNDNRMLVRVFEYETQVALDAGEIEGWKLKVRIPNSGVLYLRSTKGTPERMEIEIETPGGTVSYDVKTMRMKDYSLADIFRKDLDFLVPFYPFNISRSFSVCESRASSRRTSRL